MEVIFAQEILSPFFRTNRKVRYVRDAQVIKIVNIFNSSDNHFLTSEDRDSIGSTSMIKDWSVQVQTDSESGASMSVDVNLIDQRFGIDALNNFPWWQSVFTEVYDVTQQK